MEEIWLTLECFDLWNQKKACGTKLYLGRMLLSLCEFFTSGLGQMPQPQSCLSSIKSQCSYPTVPRLVPNTISLAIKHRLSTQTPLVWHPNRAEVICLCELEEMCPTIPVLHLRVHHLQTLASHFLKSTN